MRFGLRRWLLAATVAAAGVSSLALLPSHHVKAADPLTPVATGQPVGQGVSHGGSQGGQEVVAVEKLKADAFHELRGGHFDRTNELLQKAASVSHDPQLERMAEWAKHFETQREEFAAERHKQYEKAVGDVKKLQAKEKTDYAVDYTSRAYLLADDKKTFRDEPWVDALIKDAVHRAEQYEKDEQWVRALRLYSDLGSLEPAQPLWKDRLKLTTRRVRLLGLYTPDVLKGMIEGEAKEREEVDALLRPATQPTTGPTTKPTAKSDKSDLDNDSFRINWRDTLKGVRFDALWEALIDAKTNYYREVHFRDLGLGGLNGLRAVATTKGLEKAFPELGNEQKRAAFLAAVEERAELIRNATDAQQQLVLKDAIKKIESVNKETVDLPDEVLFSEFADGAFAELDPFSSMIWPTDVEEFRKTTSGEFSGVGIQIQLDDDGSLKVVSPLEDSPAYKAGIKAGDVITKINGKNAKGISINQAVKTITGEKGTTVVLTVRSPDGSSKDYTIKREVIHVASVKGYQHKPGGGWEWFVDPDQKIAYMRLTNFTQDTGKELEKAVDAVEKAGGRGIILDLRYNPGGLLTAAVETCDKFLTDGVIVSTHPDRVTGNPPTVNRAKADEDDCHLPLIVLVNQYSASASEIVSGALKDQKRALIVGERTFGKGSVQMLFPLAQHTTLLKLTTSHYYLPNGKCIHREENSTDWGVDPDVKIEMTPEQMRAAIDARQELDILRDAANATPAEGEQPKLNDKATTVEKVQKEAGEKNDKGDKGKKKDLLSSDPQLSGAVLMLRLQLNGAQL